jgi:hypothetical protein
VTTVVLAVGLLLGPSCTGTLTLEGLNLPISVGEPLKLRVRLSADLWNVAPQALVLHVQDRRSEWLYREWQPTTCSIEAVLPPERKESRLLNIALWLGYAQHGLAPAGHLEPLAPVFPRKGRYAVRLMAQGCASNPIFVEVAEPTEEGRALVAAIANDPLGPWLAADLLPKYPKSPYLRRVRLEQMAYRLGECHKPDTAETWLHELLSDDWGAFEEEALGVALECAVVAKEPVARQTAAERLLTRWADSPTVARLRKGALLDTPPAQ